MQYYLTKMASIFQKYSAYYEYVQAINDLPPTYGASDACASNGVNGILPDTDCFNDKVMDAKFKRVDDARENVIKTCGRDPQEQYRGTK